MMTLGGREGRRGCLEQLHPQEAGTHAPLVTALNTISLIPSRWKFYSSMKEIQGKLGARSLQRNGVHAVSAGTGHL